MTDKQHVADPSEGSAGLETNSHMTNDAKPGSHSALFGLDGQKGPSTTAGSGAGSGIIGTSGHSGAANKGSVTETSTVGGMDQGGKSNAAPGSGGEAFTPSQGSGEIPSK